MRFVVAVCLVVVVLVVVVPGRPLLVVLVLLLNSLPYGVVIAFVRGYFVAPSGGFVAPPPFAAAGDWIQAWCYHHSWRRLCNRYHWRVVSRSLKSSPQKGGAHRYYCSCCWVWKENYCYLCLGR